MAERDLGLDNIQKRRLAQQLDRRDRVLGTANANGFEDEVSVEDLQSVLQESPWRERIPEILRSLKQRLKGESQLRLSSV